MRPQRVPPRLAEIGAFLDDHLRVGDYPDEPNGVRSGGEARVARLGLALEPPVDLDGWVRAESLDAILLHRAWDLSSDDLPARVGLLAYHLPFDEKLTLGFNPLLAEALGLGEREPFGARSGRPLGMLADALGIDFDAWVQRVSREFGGIEKAAPPRGGSIARVAVVGAMTDGLVREAAALGAGAYLTGQFRAPAVRAVEDTGIGVVATGHRRAEQWGLRALARLLRGRWPGLEVVARLD